jgi:hypothetical protein
VLPDQVAKAVEDILYAATQEEGESHLAAAIAELEVRDEHEQELVSVCVCLGGGGWLGAGDQGLWKGETRGSQWEAQPTRAGAGE